MATAFGFVEAAVVVYLRTFLDPDGSRFPVVQLPSGLLAVELGREAATLVLLAGVAALAAPGRTARLASFLVLFGIWDIVYYVGLRALMHWPADWRAWDLLFLLPGRWLGPVYAPIVVALTMVAAGLVTLDHEARHGTFRVQGRHYLGAAVGALVIVSSFIRPESAAFDAGLPRRFPLERLALGEVIGIAAFADAWRRNRTRRRQAETVPALADRMLGDDLPLPQPTVEAR